MSIISDQTQACFEKFKLKYDNLENIKTDCVNAVVFNSHEIKQLKFFLGYPVVTSKPINCEIASMHAQVYQKFFLFV